MSAARGILRLLLLFLALIIAAGAYQYDVGTEGGLAERDRHLADQVLVLAAEQRVLLDGHLADQVTAWRSLRAGFALSLQHKP